MKKRICSICLVLALLASNRAALAADLSLFGEVAVPSALEELLADEPLISVRLPANGWVVANPYGMEIERDGVVSSEEIVSPALVLENQSEVPVRVDARVWVTAEGEVSFVQAPPAQDTAAKEIFLFTEFQPVWDRDAEAVWSGYFRDASNQIMVTASELSKDGVMSLEAAGSPYSAGALRVFGSLSAHPDRPWMESDRFTVNFAFSFAAADGSLPAGDPDYNAVPGQAEDPSIEETEPFPEEMFPPSETLPEEQSPEETFPDEKLPEAALPEVDTSTDEPYPEEGGASTVEPLPEVDASTDEPYADWLFPDKTLPDETVQEETYPDWLFSSKTLPDTDATESLG